MAKVKVWNDNKYPHTETFKGDKITIPAGGFIEMDYVEAVEFQGQFTPIKKLGTGADDPTGFKMIRVEQPKEPVFKEDPNMVHATGKMLGSPAEVLAFAKAYAAANPDLLPQKPEGVQDGSVTLSKAEFDGLLARMAALESQTEKRGPGRPKKQA